MMPIQLRIMNKQHFFKLLFNPKPLFMKRILFLVMLLAFIIGSSCSSNSAETQSGESKPAAASKNSGAPTEAAQQMAYICPMQCEGSASDAPGKCPVCSMDLVKNPNYKGTAADTTAQQIN
ncbi:MAG: hypothetical protein JWQ14_2660 [Adhaeribacter sp.]|nr:hypothetical protein [Adhaeribacter sp.]